MSGDTITAKEFAAEFSAMPRALAESARLVRLIRAGITSGSAFDACVASTEGLLKAAGERVDAVSPDVVASPKVRYAIECGGQFTILFPTLEQARDDAVRRGIPRGHETKWQEVPCET